MRFDFIKNRRIYFIISIAIIALTLVCAFAFGVNLDIEFKGGTIITYSYEGDIDKAGFEAAIEDIVGKVTVRESRSIATGVTNLVVTLGSNEGLTPETMEKVNTAVEEPFSVKHVESSTVDPVIGTEMLLKSLVAVAVASVLMIVFIGIRFRKIGGWSAGVCAVIALINDIFVVFATFVIFGISIDTNFMAVVLTILGYSVNDTIVIYDRIRENKNTYGDNKPVAELVNISLNECFRRTLLTTITTVSALIVVCVVAVIFNVNSILSFTFPMMIGMIHGVYSSVAIAPQLWVLWKERKSA